MLPLLYACTKEKPQSAAAKGYAQQEILISLILEQNVFLQRERYLVLKQYLADRLGATVTRTSLSRNGDIVSDFQVKSSTERSSIVSPVPLPAINSALSSQEVLRAGFDRDFGWRFRHVYHLTAPVGIDMATYRYTRRRNNS
jgi:hypothetical protein